METIDVQNRSFVVRWLKCCHNDVINFQIKPLKKSIDISIYKKVRNSNESNEENETFINSNSNPNIHIVDDKKALLDYNSKVISNRSTSVSASMTTLSSQQNDQSFAANNNGSTATLKSARQTNTHRSSNAAKEKFRSNSTSNLSNNSGLSNDNSSTSLKETEITANSKPRRSLSINNIQQQSQAIPLNEKLTKSGFTLVKNVGHIQGNLLVEDSIKVVSDNDNEDFYYVFVFDNSLSKNVKKKLLFNMSLQSFKKKEYNRPVSPIVSLESQKPIKGKQQLKKSISNIGAGAVLTVGQGRYIQGYLLKKRRKRLQGFTKRFFSLDLRYGTLSYYMNDHNQTFRGEILINLSSVSANKKDKLIIIDSGMEIWALKATSTSSWEQWVNAFQSCFDNERIEEKQSFEGDAKTVSQKYTTAPVHDNARCEFNNIFMKTKNEEKNSYSRSANRIYSELQENLVYLRDNIKSCKNESKLYVQQNSEITTENHELYEKLSKLEVFLDDYINSNNSKKGDIILLSQHKSSLSQLAIPNTGDRLSSISAFSDEEFFDAEESLNRVIILPDEQIEMDHELPMDTMELTRHDTHEEEFMENDNEDSLSDNESNKEFLVSESIKELELRKEKYDKNGKAEDLYPLPIKSKINRRNDISASIATPPSLLSFLRKNVGKDLSSVTMPVTANEPISILQCITESFEYADILSNISSSDSTFQPLAVVSAFAVSALSIHRDKTRVMRKPFNPLLGETYEFISDTMNFRLIAEKVSHKPQIFAFHADHIDWECDYTVSPVQTFWGKSIELNNEGIVKLTIKKSGEVFEWVQPTTMLKNLIAGEKYIEPINEFKVLSSEGGYSKVIFRSSGMFGGRSEDLTININPSAKEKRFSKEVIMGKWTESLYDKKSKKIIWEVKDLVPQPKKKYGFTKFTANLNEITPLECDFLPPTDSRLRPDIRAYENGELDKAESLKIKLEQQQRERRIDGKDVKPKYFKKVSEKEWEFIHGPTGYWERRKRGDWADIDALW